MAETAASTVFGISIEGNAAQAGNEIGASAIAAAKAIMRFDDETKSLQAELRRLRGNSEEVVNAKKELRARIDETRSASSQLALQLRKEGSSFTEAAKLAKDAEDLKAKAVAEAEKRIAKAREEGDRLSKKRDDEKAAAAKKVADKNAEILKKSRERGESKRDSQKAKGGIVSGFLKAQDMRARFTDLKGATGSSGGALKAMIGEARLGTSALQGMGSMAGMAGSAVIGVGAAGVAAVVGIGAATAALISFALASSDAAQKAQRQREALLGNAGDAKRMGDQIDELAGKVPQGADELNQLSLSLSKTRLSGKAMVDTMNAVAQASGAVDAEAGKKLQDIITRGQNTGRMSIGKRELQGTGLEFDDVAKQYAAGTKKSLAAARKELSSGRAPLEAGAEAIRKATEAKFGKLNKKNAFSLENGPKKIMQAFTNLTKGVNLDPLFEGFEKIYNALSPESPLGSAVKTLVEALAGGFAKIVGDSIPAIIEGFKWLVVGALKVGSKFYELKKAIMDVFRKDGWSGVGKFILDGLIEGLKKGATALVDAVKWVAKKIKDAFSDELKIQSPSKVFEGYGKYSTQGYAQGITKAAPAAEKAVEQMAAGVSQNAGVGGVAAGAAPAAAAGDFAPVLHFHVGNEAAAEAMRETSTLAAITRAVRAAYVTTAGARAA